MFIRISIHVRRDNYLTRDASQSNAYQEREYPDDLVGEMSASEDAAKLVNSAMDKLAEEERKREHD